MCIPYQLWFAGKYVDEHGFVVSPTNSVWGQELGQSRGFVYASSNLKYYETVSDNVGSAACRYGRVELTGEPLGCCHLSTR